MPRKRGVTFEEVQAVALALPGVEAGSSYGTPGLRVGGKLMARLREDDVLVLKPVDEVEQRFLMDTHPAAFFLTEHYRGYRVILVRLSQVDAGQLAELIEQCWRRLATKRLLAAPDQTPGSPQPSAARVRRA